MVKEGQFLSSTRKHSMGFQKKRKSLITEDMVEDINMVKEEKEAIVEIKSDKVSQHSVQEKETAGVNARDSSTSGCPKFEVEMQKNHMSRPFQMHIPMNFAKLHLPSFSTVIIVRNMKGKKWRMNLNFAPRSQRRCFTTGWKNFASENSLNIGDYCRFELVGTNELLCHIYRDCGQKHSPESRTRRGPTIYEESSKRKKNEKDAPEVPDASRCVAKRKSPHNASAQTESVDSLFHSLGFDKYSDIFHTEEIDIAALKLMTEEDLKLLGVPMGPRKKIIDALKSSA